MPELPEVEVMCRNLSRWSVGRVLERVDVVDPRVDSGGVRDWAHTAAGRSVARVWRRGKYAVLELSDAEHSLILHFRMTGKVVAADPAERRSVRLVLRFQPNPHQPDCVVFDDVRRLGNAWAIASDRLTHWFDTERKLGPEPWPTPRAATFWAAQLGTIRSPIKVALMRQDRVAGLGNIAASEILWRAGIAPTRLPGALDDAQWGRIARAAPAFITETIEQEGGDEIAYVNSRGGSAQGIPSPFSVYRCDGQPCPRCGAPIERFKQAGRSTFWCAGCQE